MDEIALIHRVTQYRIRNARTVREAWGHMIEGMRRLWRAHLDEVRRMLDEVL